MSLTNLGFGFHGGGGGGGSTPGPQGTPGSVWRNGSGVPSNSLGINGDYYLNNDDGFVYARIAGAYVYQATIKGADGTNGTNGSVWYSGSGAPVPSLSYNPNDFYLDNNDGEVYQYDGSNWIPQTNIFGTDGTNGSVWYSDSGFPPPAGTYNPNDLYLDTDTNELYQYDGTNWNQVTNIQGTNGSQWYTDSGDPTTIYNDGDFYLNATNGDIWEQVSGSWNNTGTNIKGTNGTNGTDGSIWYSGAVFPPTSPPTYNPNDFFLDTTNGNVYQYDGSLWQFQLTLSGVAGSSWFNGNGAPTVIENDGDYYLDDLTGDVYTQVSGAWTGPVANITGPQGANGADGQDGSSSSYFFYRTKDTIIVGDPLAKHIRWNNATQISSSELGISKETEDAVDISIFLALLQVGDIIVIQDKDVAANFQTWEVNSSITDNPTWVSVPVSLVTSGGTGTSNFANNLEIIIAISREGTAGTDGANSTRFGFDNTTTAPSAPNTGRFNADNTDITLISAFSFDVFNIDGIDFTQWLQTLWVWFDTKAPQNNYLQIRQVGTTNVIGSYEITNIKDFITYYTIDVIFLAGTGTLDPTQEYSVSYAVAGSDGNVGAQGVAGPNTDYWFFDTTNPLLTPPSAQNFSIDYTGVNASGITSFYINDDDFVNQNQFAWLEYARNTASAGNVGFLSVTQTNNPTFQSIFTISSITDNSGYHIINVSFLGGYDYPLSSWVLADLFAFSYFFNGAGGGGTITVKYPNSSTIVDSAVNTMLFTGGGVNVSQLSAGNVEINIPTAGTFGAIVAQIRSLSVSTTLSPFTVGALTIPYNGTITGWTIFSDVAGNCEVDFGTSTYAAYPPTGSIFPIGDAPNLVSDVKNELTGLSIAVTQGDVLLCDLTTISGTMSRIDVTLLITKS
jgi:hypothetical protein